jgi:sec-independent protein translocase protein TatB
MTMPPTIEFASLGMWDSLILMVMALVVFGPRRLPQIGRQIGKLMYEFRKASNDFKFQMEEELRSAEEADRRKQEEARLRALAPSAQTTPALTAESESSSQSPESSPAITAEVEPSANAYPVGSPYPGEGLYPEISSPEPPEPPDRHIHPSIQPPSTGEPIPASRPGSLPSQIDASIPAPEFSDAEPSPVAEPSPAEPTPEEPVNHNG